jgi:dTDP-4-amino-4,6-dideoxygalactose transaminase
MNPANERILLSPPHVTESEVESAVAALRTGWVAPLGPEVDQFEVELAQASGRSFAVALSSGTAALHLALIGLGVQRGDHVVVPTLTFGATAFAVTYVGAVPIFVDSEEVSMNLDPEVLEALFEKQAAVGALPAAVITVDLFGRTCDYGKILPICERFGVPIISDSAEALGASFNSQPAGSTGECAVFSFNGNKIITTSGGGVLVTDNAQLAEQARFRATQAREPYPWYEHKDIGYNYRMSNILAAIGRSQLARLPDIIDHRRGIREISDSCLSEFDGVTVYADPPWGRWNGWLTTVRFNRDKWPKAPQRVREALAKHNVESRPIWKPMHQQPVFAGVKASLTGVADKLFEEGLCLPSGTGMQEEQVRLVAELIVSELVQ